MAKQIDLNLLQALEALLAERNVTRAAARLHVSQPALSAQLVRLRKMFNDPLLIAGSRGMTPTPRALELAPKLSELISGFQSIVYPEVFDPASAQATILIGASDAAQCRLAGWFATLAEQAPGIKIGIMPATRLALPEAEHHIATGDIDLGISIRSAFRDTMHVRKLYTEEFVCVMRRDHPFDKRELSVRDFSAMKQVIVSPPGGDFSGETDTALREMGLAREVVVSVPSFLVAESILRKSDFAAVFPVSLANALSTTLKAYPLPFPIPSVDLCIGWHERTHHSPVHRWIRDQISESFSKQTCDGMVSLPLLEPQMPLQSSAAIELTSVPT